MSTRQKIPITILVGAAALSVASLVLVFKSDRIIRYKTTTLFQYRERIPENTIAGILIADNTNPKHFGKAATIAIGFQKPLFCYFGSDPTNEGKPIPVEMNKQERDRIVFSYLLQEKNDFTYDKSITFVCEEKEGYYIGYVIPICIRDGKVYGKMFNSTELYETLTDLFKQYNIPIFREKIKKQ